MSKSLNVAIVGAGVCGLYLAWKLSEKGHKVAVFEKKQEIGKQACSGLFSQKIFDYIPQSRNLIQNKIDYTLIHFPKKSVKVLFSEKFLVMSHSELDKLVADLAKKAGAEIILNNKVKSLPSGFDRIIGCDGAQSFVRKNLNIFTRNALRSKAGGPEPNFSLGILGFVHNKDSSNFVETWPQKTGFIWRIPQGKQIEYGIMGKPLKAKKLLKEFLEKQGIELKEIKSEMIASGLIKFSHPKITLCGEAAGLTKPWGGGGVIWGLKSCEMLLKHFPDFLAHQKAMKNFFRPKFILSKISTKMVYFFGFNLPWFLPKQVKIDGDYILNFNKMSKLRNPKS
ncbi:hypothetical protein AMJ49_04125 [Parcubacteria bacterium DG_74_2]|nr:MAG: hypothetical protein AMJ49_04125 [Parcubacteria bacterium DG_74_2]